MTTPARLSEADALEHVFHWAVNALGNRVAIETLRLWDQYVPPTAAGARAAERAFTLALLALLLRHRREGRQLAYDYYRLVRALRTGATISSDPREITVSLEELREAFDLNLDAIEEWVSGVPIFEVGDPDNDPLPDVTEELVAIEPDFILDDEVIEIDLVVDFDIDSDDDETEVEDEVTELTRNIGTRNLEKKIIRRTRKDDGDSDEASQQAKREAGNRVASTAMRVMMNASRGEAYELGSVDARIQGWVRFSTTGTPCGFCAMLIARRNIYATRNTAQHQGQNQSENKYHDNCKCVTIPIFDMDQFLDSELSSQHKYYDQLWKKHIAGKYGGVEALNAFRTLLRNMEKGIQINQSPGEAA